MRCGRECREDGGGSGGGSRRAVLMIRRKQGDGMPDTGGPHDDASHSSSGTWTFETVLIHITALMRAERERIDQRFLDNRIALDVALSASKEALTQALSASKEALTQASSASKEA